MARIDIEIEYYLDEVRTEYLVNEIVKRKDAVKELLKHKEIKIANIDEFTIPAFKTTDDVLNYIRIVLGLKKWHTKERIISEINNL